MKKTLATIILLAGVASADTLTSVTVFDNLTQDVAIDGITWNASAGTLTGGADVLYTTGASYKSNGTSVTVAHTSFAILIDLTKAQEVATSADTSIATLGNSGTVGIMATTAGISGQWGSGSFGSSRIEWDSLPVLGVIDKHKYTTLTVSVGGPNNRYVGSTTGPLETGVQVFDVNGNNILNIGNLASGDNNDFSTITFNTDIVKGIAVTPVTIATTAGGNSDTAKALAGNIPEPATATMSLLALAGLAARRRRK